MANSPAALARRIDTLETKVFRGNGHNSLEVRVNLIESDIGRIATGMEALVASEKTAMSFIEEYNTTMETRETDKAIQAENVRTDLVRVNKKKDRKLVIWGISVAAFVSLLVCGVGTWVTVHEDHYTARLESATKQTVHDSVKAELGVKK